MDQLNIGLALVFATVLALGLLSQPIKRTVVQEPMIAVAVGVLVGPGVAGWLDLSALAQPMRLVEEGARLTLAVALMAVALRIPKGALRRLWRPATVLVIAATLGMWLLGTLLAWAILGLPIWLAALVGAVVAPTDPVVASAIVTGPVAERKLPQRLRSLLSLESGANDGLAYLFVLLPILMLTLAPPAAMAQWLTRTLLLGVLGAVVLGVVVGLAAGYLLHTAKARGWIERYSYLTFTVAVSLFTLAVGHLLGAESLLSVFAAGLTFDLASRSDEQHDEERVQEAVGKLCIMPIFVVFGVVLPVEAWRELGWPLAALVVALLLFRRLPILLALAPAMGRGLPRRDAVFLGWFGPIGVAAIFYAAFATETLGEPVVWHVASAAVLGSVIAHGMTATPFTELYARYAPRRRSGGGGG